MKTILRCTASLVLSLRASLWFLPSVMVVAAFLLAVATVLVDRNFESYRAGGSWFLFGVGADGARGVLAAIAGSVITVAGVVFSITIVALQLASTQYSPRVLRTFLEDRGNQVVLGVFIGTFTYSLLILRTVRGESDELDAFVPSISVSVALLLGLASVGFLIYFVNHIAQSVRASVIVERLMQEAVHAAKRAFPRELGEPVEPDAIDDLPPDGAMTVHAVTATRPGYLRTVDENALMELPGAGVVIRMEILIGDFVREGDLMATILAPPGIDPGELVEQVRELFSLGSEATGPQDVALGISRLVDVAVRALSPGVNDPTTAASCLDAISQILVTLGTRERPAAVRRAADGKVCLIARYPTFEELVQLAFGAVRHHGASDPAIALKLLEVAGAVGRRLPPARRRPIALEAARTLRAAEMAMHNPDYLGLVQSRAEEVLRALGSTE